MYLVHKSVDTKYIIRIYRPHTKFSIFPKILQAIISKKYNSLLISYGFIKKNSVFTNLLIYRYYLINDLDHSFHFNAFYCWLSKSI